MILAEGSYEKVRWESYSDSQEMWAGRLHLWYYQKGLGLLTYDSSRIFLETGSPQILFPSFESLTYSGPKDLTQVPTFICLSLDG